jgi:hypothetical protein
MKRMLSRNHTKTEELSFLFETWHEHCPSLRKKVQTNEDKTSGKADGDQKQNNKHKNRAGK